MKSYNYPYIKEWSDPNDGIVPIHPIGYGDTPNLPILGLLHSSPECEEHYLIPNEENISKAIKQLQKQIQELEEFKRNILPTLNLDLYK